MIRYVTEIDMEGVLTMMEKVKDDFAGYKEKEFLEALRKAIDAKEAFLDEESGQLAGMILYSRQEKEVTFLAVSPAYRKQGIGKKLIERVKECFTEGDVLQVITFRSGDLKGIAARNCYHSCGFVDAEELAVFDYPCQKMIFEIRKGYDMYC